MTSDGELIGGPKNDTNLAVKGIIGLKAYGDVLSSLGRANHYQVCSIDEDMRAKLIYMSVRMRRRAMPLNGKA